MLIHSLVSPKFAWLFLSQTPFLKSLNRVVHKTTKQRMPANQTDSSRVRFQTLWLYTGTTLTEHSCFAFLTNCNQPWAPKILASSPLAALERYFQESSHQHNHTGHYRFPTIAWGFHFDLVFPLQPFLVGGPCFCFVCLCV